MIEASGEEGDSDEEKETTEPPAECPAHKETAKTAKAVVMTDAEIYANAVGFLIAGNETTSMTLSYTSYLLALNPDVQEKLQSEIDAYFEDKPVSSLLLLSNLK
jgi:cytochrome P450